MTAIQTRFVKVISCTFFKYCFFLSLWFFQVPAIADINSYFNQIKTDPKTLYAFLKTMPKGGELHYHLDGGVSTKVLLALATSGDFCLNKRSLMIFKSNGYCNGVQSKDLIKNSDFYERTLRAWSMHSFIDTKKESGHDHFFKAFDKIRPIVTIYPADLLVDVIQRAYIQNEQYLEIMILPDKAASAKFNKTRPYTHNFTAIRQKLLKNKNFQKNIQLTNIEATKLLKQARKKLNCHTRHPHGACQLTVKFQYCILREQPLAAVFAQTLNGFAAAAISKDLVGVNLVQPEDGNISLHDYHQQMQIFEFMHRIYPKVHISLHAGELIPETVNTHNLSFHIREAILIGHAQRIGHGVDIKFEKEQKQLLKKMADSKIAVEINLISNKSILGITGTKHPLLYYLEKQIPVILSTDDEGILDTNLTKQYMEAILTYSIDYKTLKMINRNTLSYSFLPGKSLWTNNQLAKPVKSCSKLNSHRCMKFLKINKKAALQWQLEKKLTAFENSRGC